MVFGCLGKKNVKWELLGFDGRKLFMVDDLA